MAYLQSPGLQIVEKNVSSVTTGLSSTTGAYVGCFQWGPVMSPQLIDSESTMTRVFGYPDNDTYSHFFAVTNFLAYSTAMWVCRAANGNKNATVDGSGLLINNIDVYETSYSAGQGNVGAFAARYPGVLGNGLIVSIADSGNFANWAYKSIFSTVPNTSAYAASKGGSNDELHVVVVDQLGKFTGSPGTVVEKYAFVSKASDAISYQGTNNYYVDVIRNQSQYVYWMDHDVDGTNWGSLAANTTFASLGDSKYKSITVTAATCSGTTATLTYGVQGVAPFAVGETINVTGITPVGYNGTYKVVSCSTTTVTFVVSANQAAGTVFGTVNNSGSMISDFVYTLSGGTDDNAQSATNADSNLMLGWDLFKDSQTYDVSLLITGNASTQLSAYVATQIALSRADCLSFHSITTASTGRGTPILASSTTRLIDAVAFKNFDSSYSVIDSGYKYMYDKYTDKNRWIALNSDIAGLCARVDITNDTWFSPAGIVKGQINGVIKLAWNPNKAERDILYPAAVNPVITWTGQGTMLYGDKTATLKPSAFDRINVRRLFLALEKSISNSAKYQLFEINDQYTRLQFVASVEPFLRDVKGRRGIEDFKVICDSTNNTGQIISTNQFVGTILIRPLYSINFLTLNFVAVGPNVTFDTAAAA